MRLKADNCLRFYFNKSANNLLGFKNGVIPIQAV
jgi:hypothetical protein